MSRAEDTLAELRAQRNAARRDLLARYQSAREMTKPAKLAKRLRQDVEIHARNAMGQAVEIASDNRGVLVGTISALMLWAGRRKLFGKAREFAPRALPLWRRALELLRACGIRKIETK